jgi:hypothetical protein
MSAINYLALINIQDNIIIHESRLQNKDLNRSAIHLRAGHIARMEQGRTVLKTLTFKPMGKGPLGRRKQKWDNVRMLLKRIGVNSINWIDLV